MISQRIKMLREKKGLSQRELAEIVSMSQQAIAKWEMGKAEPDIKMINKLADFFDVDVNYLFGNSDFPTSPRQKDLFMTADDALRILASQNNLSERDKKELEGYVELLKIRANARKFNEQMNVNANPAY